MQTSLKLQGTGAMTRCLRLPAFRRLLAAYVLNELAWSVGTLALSVLVYRHTRQRARLGGVLHLLPVPPGGRVSGAGGPAGLTRRPPGAARLYALEAVLFGMLAWFPHHFTLVPVLALALADGVIAAAARSMAAAARTQILKPRDLLQRGQRGRQLRLLGAFMAGPVIGGLVVAAGGTVAALLVNCGLFAGIALMLSLTALPGPGLRRGPDSAGCWTGWGTSGETGCSSG